MTIRVAVAALRHVRKTLYVPDNAPHEIGSCSAHLTVRVYQKDQQIRIGGCVPCGAHAVLVPRAAQAGRRHNARRVVQHNLAVQRCCVRTILRTEGTTERSTSGWLSSQISTRHCGDIRRHPGPAAG